MQPANISAPPQGPSWPLGGQTDPNPVQQHTNSKQQHQSIQVRTEPRQDISKSMIAAKAQVELPLPLPPTLPTHGVKHSIPLGSCFQSLAKE